MLRLFVCLMVMTVFFDGISQDYIDLIRLDYNYTTPSRFSDSREEDKGQFEAVLLDVALPIRINEKLAVLSGLNFEGLSVDLMPHSEKRHFYSLSAKFGVHVKHSANWSATYLFYQKYRPG